LCVIANIVNAKNAFASLVTLFLRPLFC